MNKKLVIGWSSLWVATTLVYILWIRNLVVQSFYDTAPDWFNQLVNSLYPRFLIEKHRFELSFFLGHADQIIIRLGLITCFLVFTWFARNYWKSDTNWLDLLWHVRIPQRNIQIYTWVVYTCVIYFTYDWYIVLTHLYEAQVLYKPLLLLRLLHLSFPSPIWIGIGYGLLLIGCLGMLFRFKSSICAMVVAIVFTLLQGWLYSFEKLDHAFAPLTYVLWLMPLLIIQTNHSYVQWALPLIRMVIGIVYLQAGLEKLLIGGMEWLDPETFRNYLYLHSTPTGLWVANQDWLCILLPAMALLFQLSFIIIVFFPATRWIILPVGVLFHSSTYILMGVGGIVNAWIWLYGLFLFDGLNTKNADLTGKKSVDKEA
ncbi:HTTM domain-containing protein [Cytophagaceae bacterium YF14B1]|uniref:HTTM domain-containing protein n=1 Tax=Xanthocytophaga flava TaxID=3048013 RepID=A0AAE3QWA0_9BACT|nr:HTTM domain-containing protein [Xanthocytophaga flavus]MDJ1484405.1 HTTM domain-containing protein [Xanthocytophaga flavus]